MEPSIEIIEPKLFPAAVADEIVASLIEAISEGGSASLALSGGRTPSSIYRALAMPPRVDLVEWDKVRLYWGDERWVPATDVQSNYKMVSETLLQQIKREKPHVFPIDTALPSAQKSAEAYAKALRTGEKTGESFIPSLDLVLLGIGEDGHCASLFPGDRLLKESSALCGVATGAKDGLERVTFTPPLILAAKRVIFIVKGAEKAEVLKRVMESDESVDVLPARLYTRAQGKVSFFIDSEAAKLLAHGA